MSARQQVFSAINDERIYQDRKWGTLEQHPHEVGSWLTITRKLLSDADAAYAGQLGDRGALDELRKVAAVSVACLEQHGAVPRSPADFAAQSSEITVSNAAASELKPTATSPKDQWINENLKPGEVYAGLILGKGGKPDHHLILLPGEVEKITWPDAKDWAAGIGGELPARREQALLYANLKEHFQSSWYWSCEQHASGSDFAWAQSFSNGNQLFSYTDLKRRARAVRRLEIL